MLHHLTGREGKRLLFLHGTPLDHHYMMEAIEPVFGGPSLVVSGRQDSMSGYRDALDLTEQFPRVTLAVLDAAGHGLAFARPTILHELMRDWLARLGLVWPASV